MKKFFYITVSLLMCVSVCFAQPTCPSSASRASNLGPCQYVISGNEFDVQTINYLIKPTSVTPTAPTGGTVIRASGDDFSASGTLPFSLTIYGKSYAAGSAIIAGSNGIFFGGSLGNTSFTNTSLPWNFNTTGPALLAYWDDLYFGNLPEDGVYVHLTGTAPNRQFSVLWQGEYFFNTTIRASFGITFTENSPNFTYNYYNLGGRDGISATVGIQESSTTTSQYTQYSFDQAIIPSGSQLLLIPQSYTLSGATTGTGIGSLAGLVLNTGVTTITLENGKGTCAFDVTVTNNSGTSPTFEASGTASCGSPIRLTAQITGTSFVFTGPGGYVFSNVYRNGGSHTAFAEGITLGGTYTMTTVSGLPGCPPVTSTVTVQGPVSCPK